MGPLGQDIRFGLRLFTHSPGLAVVAVAVLVFGVGANTAIFSILNALVLRELPVPEPRRLVELLGLYRNGSRVPFSFPTFQEIGRGQRVFVGLSGRTGIYGADAEVDGVPFRTHVRAVTENYYAVLGAAPLLGRLIEPEDLNRDVAVISHAFWDERFGRDQAVLGSTVRLQDRPFVIVGVTRRWFAGVTPGQSPEITIPASVAPFPRESRSSLWIYATGRLNEGVTIGQARSQLDSFWHQVLLATVPTESPGERRQSFLSMRLEVESVATGASAGLRSKLLAPIGLLMGLVALILAIGCVNLASLTLARAARREREMSTRMALGASRGRIVRQLLTESALLAAAAAAPAFVLAYWGSELILNLLSQGTAVPVILDLGPDWRVFSFSALALILTTVLVGAAPAWRLSRETGQGLLQRHVGGFGRGTHRLGKVLIIAQVAQSLVLMHGAGLLLRTLERLHSLDPGFVKVDVLKVNMYPSPAMNRDLDMAAYRRQLLERVSLLPGVDSVAVSNLSVPTGEDGWSDTASLISDQNSTGEFLTQIAFVTPGFFETLGIPFSRGRDFDWRDDDERPPVAIVSAGLAQRLLPVDNLVGKRVRFGVQPYFENLEVVGVVESARLVDLRDSDAHVVYVPGLQHPRFSRRGNLYVRGNSAADLVRAIEHEIRSFGQEYSTTAQTLQRSSEQALRHERVTAMLAGVFGSVALILAGIGLFGLMSYTVTRRTHEIGVRMALGSQRAGILRMVLGDAFLLTLAGLAVGIPCGIVAGRLMENALFGVSPTDPHTLLAAGAVLLGVGAIAGYLPARRATSMNPLVALRHD